MKGERRVVNLEGELTRLRNELEEEKSKGKELEQIMKEMDSKKDMVLNLIRTFNYQLTCN